MRAKNWNYITTKSDITMHLLCKCCKHKTNMHLQVTSLCDVIIMKTTRRTLRSQLSKRLSCISFGILFLDIAELLKLISNREILP